MEEFIESQRKKKLFITNQKMDKDGNDAAHKPATHDATAEGHAAPLDLVWGAEKRSSIACATHRMMLKIIAARAEAEEEGGAPPRQKVSLSRLRELFWHLTCVWVLEENTRHWGHRFLCCCSVFLKRGQCAHVAYVRWLEGDREVQLAALKELTRGRGQRSAGEVEIIARAPAIAPCIW